MAAPEDESSAQSQSSSATAAPTPPPSSSPSSAGDHYLAKCILRPSVVLQVAYGYFRSLSSRDIVFGKVRVPSYSSDLYFWIWILDSDLSCGKCFFDKYLSFRDWEFFGVDMLSALVQLFFYVEGIVKE